MKNNIRYNILLFISFFCLHSAKAQLQKNTEPNNKTVDSLLNNITKAINDTSEPDPEKKKALINSLIELGSEYNRLNQFKKALSYLQKAENLSRNSNFKKELIRALNNIGDTFERQHIYETAIQYYQLALTLNIELNNKEGMEKSYKYIGLVCYYQDKYEMALDNLQKSIKISQERKNKEGMADTYSYIGNIYWYLGNHEKALDNYLKAADISETNGNRKGVADSYYDIGYVYLYQHDFKKASETFLNQLKISETIEYKSGISSAYNGIGDVYEKQADYENAIKNYTKYIEIVEEIKDSFGIARGYGNIGIAYSHQGMYNEALHNYLNSLKIGEKIGYKIVVTDAYFGIGEIYLKQNKFREALYNLNQALIRYKKMGYKDGIKDTYSSLSELYEKTGDYKLAYIYYTLHSDIKDTLFNELSNKQIMEMGAKYESQKKEKDIELLIKDKALQQAGLNRQRFTRNGFIIGLCIAILFALLLYNRYITKQKLNIILSNKNDELIKKNTLIEQQNEKIIDSINYAQRIQQSILTDESEIQKLFSDSFIYYQPKDIVSGDFYWFSKINNKIIIAAIDCTGHGVPGAFMSMIGNTLLNQIVNEKYITTPSEILYLLNLGIFEALHQEKDSALARDGMDISLCSIDLQNQSIEYAGAQHPLYIITGNALEVIKADKQTIGSSGLMSRKRNPLQTKYTNHTISIKKDMSIYLFTDGYTDQYGGNDTKKLGTNKFKELLITNQHLTMQEQKSIIASAHQNWKKTTAQTDDILVVGIKL